MTKTKLAPIVLAVAALMAGCSSSPKTTSLLEQARDDYTVAQGNPNVATYAPLEMRQATEAMAQANVEANERGSDDKINNLAYLAKQKIALTQEVTKRKMAEAEIAAAGKERDQMRLDSRTNEANAAKLSAERATLAAQQAQSNAAQSQLAAQQAQLDAANAQRQTQEAQARAAQLEAQLADLAAKKTARGIVITLGDVLFGTDLSRLTADGMRSAQKLADVLQQNPQRKVLIEGFADSTGAADYNQGLSERRAGAVRTALLEMGVARERIDMRGYGESFPVAGNDSAAGRQLNRRVEIILSDDSGKVIAR
ncbi:OmpA family protein [Rhodoferax sp.]|uniref:OmpA family protein n=1 Tax=Rhodoferax sp. TaxID=50421 RepID=UPI002730FA83|nr:OmpA family protein [Rhodoferax sp.]MDP1530234.1 OmpA family protein [Rhodoferax sp.]MDP1943419.1 OmpA family protein [Rhodoferax sp.]MDP2441328.1 OmpA family protein [Rhodoferax sp.]MDZ4207189.1 OmpA family protein [Rhodoferax sp.]